ncbi:hypothetical protein Tpen_1200 [Thermofilum pendens Hrk 5]|uniref:Uncharacterized protein n=2 Tax=Thermofilum pendens TaxID=2269 RepID=A1RZG8_THEPD|nr:hypothetical protein Tpen_1200 [Thermofilum pendens Hrk 5]
MATEIARILMRIQKHFAPTVHVLVPQMLFAYMVSSVAREVSSPSEVNKALFRNGVWSGTIAMTRMAKPEDLSALWPRRFDPGKLAGFVKVFGEGAWYIFAGHLPRLNAKPVADGVLWITIEEGEGKEAFYSIEVPEGVNVFYFLAGAYEGATQTAFRMLGEEERWISMWRPLPGGRGIHGFYALREIGAERIVEAAINADRDFFSTVSWEDSSRFAEELLGVKFPALSR